MGFSLLKSYQRHRGIEVLAELFTNGINKLRELNRKERLFLLGLIQEKKEVLSKAKTNYLKSNYPDSILRVSFLYYREGNFKNALRYAKLCLKNLPYEPELYYLSGLINYKLGLIDNALDSFWKTLRLDSFHPKAKKFITLLERPRK